MNTTINNPSDDRSWQEIVSRYNTPSLWRSIWQICNSVIPYMIMWYLMYKSLVYPYWVTLLLALPASGFLIRIFIIFHDCGHRSFFKTKKANNTVGIITGILAYTPFYRWHHQHWVHHATSANLDKRGIGDVWTMTVKEYQSSTPWDRFLYRSFRNPFVMFVLGPLLMVFLSNRFTNKKMTYPEKLNYYFTNLMLLMMAGAISFLIGIKAFLLIQLPIILLGQSIGLWLFYIQHQFDDVNWEREVEWNYKLSALTGSSFLKLPAVLQWFTGNIGFHHVHHLSPRIPNYYLAKCHYENEIFRAVKPIRLLSTFKALTLSLWDEDNRRMIRFKELATAQNFNIPPTMSIASNPNISK